MVVTLGFQAREKTRGKYAYLSLLILADPLELHDSLAEYNRCQVNIKWQTLLNLRLACLPPQPDCQLLPGTGTFYPHSRKAGV